MDKKLDLIQFLLIMFFKKTEKFGAKRSLIFAKDVFELQNAIINDSEIKIKPGTTLSGWINKDKKFAELIKDYIKL